MSDKELDEVSATLTIDMHVDCPNDECSAYINLMDPRDTEGRDFNDCGALLEQACPSEGHWSEEHEKFEVEEVSCTQCQSVFNVKGLYW